MSEPRTFEEAEAALAESLPGYESRTQQQTLARAVEDAIAEGNHLLAQAGTGTGKSLGYLIPAILAGKRIVVSTATKALQDQIANKDLPFLAEHLGVPFTYSLLKGRSNYACAAKAYGEEALDLPGIERVLDRLNEDPYMDPIGVTEVDDLTLMTEEVFSGDRTDFEFDIDDRTWRGITSSPDDCPGKKECPFGGTCYAERAKRKSAIADVVVVNHALFFVDLVVRLKTDGYVRMLGDFDVVICDEGHELEEYATSAFGAQFTQGTLRFLLNDIDAWARRANRFERIEDVTTSLRVANENLWNILPSAGRIHHGDIVELYADALVEITDGLTSAAAHLSEAHPDRLLDARRKILHKRAGNLLGKFIDIVLSDENTTVRWIEEDRDFKGNPRKRLCSAPVSVADLLRDTWEGKQAIIVSATLPFDYTAERLGIESFRSIDVGTPFDYPNQAVLYIPEHLPEPSPRTRQQWQGEAIDEIEWLVNESGGGALLLFTSNKDLNDAYNALRDRLPYTLLKQGERGRTNKQLAAEFDADEDSVLFATRSFFTGVDFQGSTCRLVVMSKLPFRVPSEPVFEARCEVLKKQGINDFVHFSIPEMQLPLMQGFGRLIRHRNDRGVVAILDKRLKTKSWAKPVLNSLPPARQVSSRDGVREFFSEMAQS